MRTAREIGISLARHIRNMVLSACVLFFGLGLHAQCPDFMDLTAPGVTCQYGSTSNPFQWTGIAAGRHTLITGQGADPHTNYQLPFLPSGESQVIRLGNDNVGGEAEAITYQFTVNPDYSILLVKFAVVLEDPFHDPSFQPRFVMRVVDNAGHLVSSCSEYDVSASGEIPGFSNYGMIRWRPWTNVGLDLTEYAGQQIRVQFITYDCGYTGHFGYAYFTASCISSKLSISDCDGQTVTFSAPQGFSSYEWSNGSTSYSANYPQVSSTVTCHVTSATGCEFNLMATLLPSDLPLENAVFYDTICEGETYQNHLFNLSPPYQMGMNVFRQVFYNSSDCSGVGVTYSLYLTVNPQYYHFYDEACEGYEYHNHGFHYTSLQSGIIYDTIMIVPGYACDTSYYCLQLTVYPSVISSGSISGESSVCEGSAMIYHMSFSGHLNTYLWDIPDGVENLFGNTFSSVGLIFTSEAPNPAEISVMAGNACGSRTFTMSVWHSPSYHFVYQDTICAGSEYHNHGIHTALLDSAGHYVLSQENTTVGGCDSNVVVRLVVAPTPAVTTLAQPEEVCVGETVTIHAVGENGGGVSYIQPSIRIGDILCTDNTIEKPTDWPVAGKTAKAIVFYVDTSGQHGWAVHLEDQSKYDHWNHSGTYPVSQYNTGRAAMSDLNGFLNTQIISAISPSDAFGFGSLFSQLWYVPSLGQLRILYEDKNIVNVSLQLVGGTPLFVQTSEWWITVDEYWSSTIKNSNTAWGVKKNGTLFNMGFQYYPSTGLAGLPSTRLICDF